MKFFSQTTFLAVSLLMAGQSTAQSSIRARAVDPRGVTVADNTYYPAIIADGDYTTGAGTDNANAINEAIAAAAARSPNSGIIQLPCGFIRVNSAINMTNNPGVQLRGCGVMGPGPIAPTIGHFTVILCETGLQKGAVCVDTTGSNLMRIQDIDFSLKSAYTNPSTVAILQGRDRGPDERNNHCFESGTRINNFGIFTDSNPTLNHGHGYIGIANTGAENGGVDHFQIQANTPVVHDAGNSLELFASPYQTLAAGCPASVVGISYRDGSILINVGEGGNGFLFNGGGQLEIDNIVFIGGGGASSSNFAIYLPRSVSHLTVTNSGAEQFRGRQSNLIGYKANLDHIHISMAGDSKVADSGPYVQPLADNLSCQACEFDIWVAGGIPPEPFGNAFGGQLWAGGRLVWMNATSFSMSNWTVQNVIFQTPKLSNTDITFGRGSSVYWENSSLSHDFSGPIHAHDGLVISGDQGMQFNEGSAPATKSGTDTCYGDSASHTIKCSYNNSPFLNVPQVVAGGTFALSKGLIASGGCAPPVTVDATAVRTGDIISWSYSSAPVPSTDGRLLLSAWASPGNANFILCNPTSGAVTPSGLNVNWRVVR
jgi:hypothetical protein